MYLFHVKGVS